MTKTTEAVAADVDGAAAARGIPICAVAASASASILALDQFTKLWVVSVLPLGAHIRVIPGLFDLVHVRNTGAAFGMLSGQNTFLILASVLTLLILWRWRRSLHDNRPARAVVLGVMIGGILGNLVDRVRVGSVIDFLDFYVGTHHWPAFNVADASICIGIFLALLLSMRGDRDGSGGEALDDCGLE